MGNLNTAVPPYAQRQVYSTALKAARLGTAHPDANVSLASIAFVRELQQRIQRLPRGGRRPHRTQAAPPKSRR